MARYKVNNRIYRTGDRVKTTMGCRNSGVISERFSRQKCTDGTFYDFDPKRHLPVKWDDGTQGYSSELHIALEN